MKVALITVTYESAAALRRFWPDVSEQPYEWIVADNASQDDSAAVAKALGARVVEMGDNLGFSAANNAAVGTTDADVLIFCNPDVTVTDEGVERLAARAVETGGLVAPQLLNPDGSPQENGRGTPFPIRKLKHRLGIEDPRYNRVAGPGETRSVVWVMGAVVAMTRTAYDRIGGWDDGFFIYYEDADIGIRAIQHGLSVIVDGDVRWTHGWARETGSGFSASAWRHERRAATRFYLRKHPYVVVPIGRRARQLAAVDRDV